MIKLKYTLVLASLLLFASCNEQNKQIADTSVETNDIISIQKQGTFAVGGSVKKSPGTFDPITHGAFNPRIGILSNSYGISQTTASVLARLRSVHANLAKYSRWQGRVSKYIP